MPFSFLFSNEVRSCLNEMKTLASSTWTIMKGGTTPKRKEIKIMFTLCILLTLLSTGELYIDWKIAIMITIIDITMIEFMSSDAGEHEGIIEKTIIGIIRGKKSK